MPNSSSVQIISPTLGVIRNEPLEDAAGRCSGGHLLEHVGEQAGDEAVEEARLGEREAEPLDAGDLVAHLGLAGDRLDHLAEDDADADAGADRAEAAADPDPEARRNPGEAAKEMM